jgi:hypothetical protein
VGLVQETASVAEKGAGEMLLMLAALNGYLWPWIVIGCIFLMPPPRTRLRRRERGDGER